MKDSQFQNLIEKCISDQCSAEEMQLLHELLKNPEYISKLEVIMDQQLADSKPVHDEYSQVVDRLKKSFEEHFSANRRTPVIRISSTILRWSVAAAILILAGTLIFLQISGKSSKQNGSVPIAAIPAVKNDVGPGKEGAILTLNDGRTVVLDSLGNGIITDQNGAKVVLNNGELAYNAKDSINGEVAYNTIATPKGRQFRLLLGDGTKVWLNAASSLRYPTVFTGNERVVEITGEAYFEVAKNAKMPFHVKINNETEIVVLGTHFNVNSYQNEASINTTLLEGSVRVINGKESALLTNGQQAQSSLLLKNKIKVVSNVNVERIMAWKYGVFDFQDASLGEVMRQLERWYNIDVVYEKGIPDLEFMGKMGRDLTLSEVLRGLEMSEVHFKIEGGRKLIVMP